MTNAEVEFICEAIELVAKNFETWGKDYCYNTSKNEYIHHTNLNTESDIIMGWFNLKHKS